jgi:hypothetical protein
LIPEGPSEGDRVAAPRKSNFSAVPATATPIASRRNRPQQARHHERTGGGNRNKISVENEWSFKNIPLIATAVATAVWSEIAKAVEVTNMQPYQTPDIRIDTPPPTGAMSEPRLISQVLNFAY